MIRTLAALAAILATTATTLSVDNSTHLRPGRTYRSAIAPTLTFRTADTRWWAYQRPTSAFNVRRATGPGDSQIIAGEMIEIVTFRSTLAHALALLRAPAGLQVDATTAQRIGPHAAHCFDASGNTQWDRPAPLAGEQISSDESMRICAWRKGAVVVAALINSDQGALPGFLPTALRFLAHMR